MKEKKLSIVTVPTIVCTILSLYSIIGICISLPPDRFRVICWILFFLAIWIVSLAFYSRKKFREEKKHQNIYGLSVIWISIILGLFMAITIWSRHRSLSPYAMVNNGKQHVDTLFFSSIAESYKRGFSFNPSILLNREPALHYHTFSPFLLSIVSSITGIDAFYVYSYLYPIIFLPLYIFLQFKAILSAKIYFENSYDIQTIDITIVALFNLGLFYNSISQNYGIWYANYIDSESFLSANCFLLLFLSILFSSLNNVKSINPTNKFLLYTPLFVFLTAWCKISVSVILFVFASYFLLRTSINKRRVFIKSIGTIMVSALMMFICIKLFNSTLNTTSNILQGTITFPAYVKYISGSLGIFGNIFILTAAAFVFICFECGRNPIVIKNIKDSKTLWVELMVVVCAVGLLPELFIDIEQGSAQFFSLVINLVAIILLAGHNYFVIGHDNAKDIRKPITVICVIVVVFTALLNVSLDAFMPVKQAEDTVLTDSVQEIKNVAKKRDDYTIYLDNDAYITTVYTNSLGAIYFYPALTGIGVINATYKGDDDYYSFIDKQVKNYSVRTGLEKKISLSEAIQEAKKMGKKYLIHMKFSSFDIIDCENEEIIYQSKQNMERIFKPNKLYYSGDPQYIEADRIVMEKNSVQHGPYLKLNKGRYKIEIVGDNLKEADIFDVYSEIELHGDFGIESIENDKVTMILRLDDYTENVEFRTINLSDKEVIVNEVNLSKIE